MRLTLLSLISLAGSLACGGSSTPTQTPTPTVDEAEREPEPIARPELDELSETTQLELPRDVTLTVPARWSAAVANDILFARSPEQDLELILLELPAPSEGTHVAQRLAIEAWRRVDPSFDRRVLQAAPGNAGHGWDVVGQVVFETAPSEERFVGAVLHVKDERALIALIDARVDGLGRRGAQLNEIVGSLRIPGIVEENWMALERKPLDEAALTHLAERIEAERVRADVPGAAVALVRGDEVLLMRGFGTRAVGGTDSVTPQTRFMIGSTTKALTTLLAAKLVGEEKLRWDQPLVELLPQFALANAEATAAMTVADSFCACTGLPRRDLEFIFEYANATPQSTLAALATVAPTTERGETFQYSNFVVAAGGWAVARAADRRRDLDAAYWRALDREILRPLGMRATTLDARVARRADHAEPSARNIDGEVRALPPRVDEFVDAVAPSGGAWSTVEDMARYVQLELRNGTLGDGRLVDEAALLERREPRVAITPNLHYGLGLMVGNESQLVHIGHGGNTIGFTSKVIFYPDLDLGLVVLTNLGNADGFNGVVDRMVLEAVLPIDERAERIGEQLRRSQTAAVGEMSQRLVEPTASERSAIQGDYRSDELGTMSVREVEGRIVADVGEWTSVLRMVEASGERVWIFGEPPLTGFPIQKGDGTLTLAAPQHDYVFTR